MNNLHCTGIKKAYRIFVIIVCAVLPCALFAQKIHFTIQGTTKIKADSATLSLVLRNTVVPFSSSMIKNGFFKITGDLPEPTPCRLEVGSVVKSMFIGNENILVSIDEHNKVTVKGSALTDDNDRYNQSIFRDKMNYVKSSGELDKMNDAGNSILIDSLSNTKNNSLADIFILTKHFITSNTSSFVGFYLLNYYSKSYPLKDVKDMYEGFAMKFSGYPTDSALNANLKLYEDLSVNQPAPAFTLINEANDTFNLEKYSGKYLLLDFWASWCQPCIRNIPELKRLKSALPAGKLAMLNISFDNNKTNWEKAIKKYQLQSFTNLRLEDGFKNDISLKYDIQFIPSSFLIGPDGKILGKNLSTDEILAIVK